MHLLRTLDDGSLRFLAPREYGSNTTVILTFEGVTYRQRDGVVPDLSQIQFRGQSPVSNDTSSVSYLFTVNGGQEYDICPDDFTWPPDQQLYHQTYSFNVPDCDYGWFSGEWTEDMHWLQWTNFHNHSPVDILWNGTNVTDVTTNVIVGQRIILSAAVNSGLVAQFGQWNVPGKCVADYVATDNQGIVTPLTALTSTNVEFCWVDSGVKTVTYYATLQKGPVVKGKVTFNVFRPAATISATTGPVAVDAAWGDLELHFGNPVTPGINFTSTLTVPDGFSGNGEWIQVATPNRSRKLNSGQWQQWAGSGLDTTYPYATGTTTEDSPGMPLTSDYLEETVNDSFQMWLMFKPSGAGSVWVPVREVGWNWSGDAARTNDVWNLNSSGRSSNPTGVDSTDYPEWNLNTTTIQWRNE